MARSLSSLNQAVGLALLTSANGVARDGATYKTSLAAGGGISFKCEARITTLNVIATFKVQVSDNDTDWYDLKLPNNAANVAVAAGTGVEVITLLALVPGDVSGWLSTRCVVTLSGAATAAADVTKIDYNTRKFGAV